MNTNLHWFFHESASARLARRVLHRPPAPAPAWPDTMVDGPLDDAGLAQVSRRPTDAEKKAAYDFDDFGDVSCGPAPRPALPAPAPRGCPVAMFVLGCLVSAVAVGILIAMCAAGASQ